MITFSAQEPTSAAESLDESRRGDAWRAGGDRVRGLGLSSPSVPATGVQHQGSWPERKRLEHPRRQQAEGSPDTH